MANRGPSWLLMPVGNKKNRQLDGQLVNFPLIGSLNPSAKIPWPDQTPHMSTGFPTFCAAAVAHVFSPQLTRRIRRMESLGPPVQYTGCLLLLTNFCGSQQSQNHPKSVYKAMNLTSLVLHHCDRTTAVTMVVQMHCHLQRYLCHKTKKKHVVRTKPFKTHSKRGASKLIC